jgi:hypothetical protein
MLAARMPARKAKLAAAFRMFSKASLDEGVAGHITVRDPEFPDSYWVNPFGMHFSMIKSSDLVRVRLRMPPSTGSSPTSSARVSKAEASAAADASPQERLLAYTGRDPASLHVARAVPVFTGTCSLGARRRRHTFRRFS